MKDNSLDGHRGKVALSDTTRNNTPQSSSSSISSTPNSGIVKCDLKTSPSTTGNANDGSTATNFDDDYNEWELGIGDLIIDLDADIEKTNERNGGGPQQGIPTSHGHHHHHSHHHHHHHNSHHQNGTTSSINPGSGVDASPNASGTAPATAFNFLGSSQPSSSNLAAAMSNSKSPRITSNSGSGSGTSSVSGTGTAGSGTNSSASGTFEHQATVDKGLKMKIKRKTVGNKYSEAKHEIVQSDTKSATSSSQPLSENINSSNSSNNCTTSASSSNSPASSCETPKTKHSSGKGRNSSHREKKEKNRDKDKSSGTRNSCANPSNGNTNTPEINGVLSVMSPLKITNSGVSLSSPAPPPLSSNSSPLPSNVSVASPSMSRSVANSPGGSITQDTTNQQQPTGPPAPLIGLAPSQQQQPPQVSTSSSPPMPNLTLKLESKFTPSPLPVVPAVVIKQEDRASSPPLKKIKMEPVDRNGEVECPGSPESPEMKDTSTCTSVGTITEPDCLGPCEPGTSVMLEGIVWQETEGGVLVVNVTWRGKTYVGTLLDCTKHDWAPPRFCESPTSDVDSKTSKGRGKRGRGGNNSSSDLNTFADARNCVQSKLRNGKGRRTTINSNASSSGFTVPNSPAKSENGATNGKRKGRPADLEISNTPPTENNNNKTSKRSRTQNRSTPTSSAPAEFPQPSSPVLIVCPEPNCSKKYKHINGLRYHQTHAHSASDSSKMDDTTTEDSKDVTNSSDNEESMQESASVSTSPAPSFANSVPSHPTTGKMMLNETALSSSSNVNSLPESDLFNLTTDLSTLASVAISDSKSEQNVSNSRPVSVPLLSTVPQELPVVNSDGDDVALAVGLQVSNPSPNAASISSPILSVATLSPSNGSVLSSVVSAVTTSVIQSSSSVDSTPISQAVTVSIPASHVIFNQGLSSSSTSTACYTASNICNNSNPLSPSRNVLPPSNVTTTFASISSISSTSSTSPSMLPLIDKNKIKQERPDKYKPKSPLATPAIRPIVPAPTPLHTLPGNVPSSHNPIALSNHGVIGSPLKPIQPKPTTLGEPSLVNPSLEGLKKEKSKHKKKSKDKDRDKKLPPLPLTPTKLQQMNPNEECEAMELTSYPSLEAVPGSSLPLPGSTHAALSSPLVQAKPPESAMDIGMPDDSINENIQSPAYSDISDANDTAPVLESEVPSGKEKEDKVGKTTPDASQSPAANISAYGMYPYYSQPPYLLPSVSPQNAVSGSQGQNIIEKSDLSKKSEQDRVKESRPWSNPSGESRERQHLEHHEPDKKSREESGPNANAIPSPAAQSGPVQDYPIQQHYPYPYGYVQGYPYPIEPSSYMHMIENDPHYKQQYKQYIEEQQRLYKEQQHHQQQQLQQQLHHQQQSQHHAHQSHHSHQSHHQTKSQHHTSIKEERDRSRESKDRSSSLDKISNSGLLVEHSNKIQHSSISLVSNKEHEVREIDNRPPSLPAQARLESSMSNSASAAALKEKQNENHQILKENIELKSQMDDSKNKMNQYAMLFEMREDMRRYYAYQDRMIEQQQQKMEPGIHHHTHHHQTIQPHNHLQAPSASYPSSASSLKPHKEDLSSSIPSHSKSSHYGDSARSSTISPAKSDHVKNPHSNSTSSPKGSMRDSALGGAKEYMSSGSSRESSSSKKDSQSKSSERIENSTREDKKGDKIKQEAKIESEGQKPTMETTGPPPPPTNSYAYLHPSYLQPAATHFSHMPFDPAHAMYRGGINPMLVSSPHYGGSPYVHPQIRYVTPGACELPAHSQPPEALSSKLHPSGPPKAIDLLHQVSQHYTTTHKIHELQEHAMMSPTPTSTPSSTPSTVQSSSSGKSSSTEPAVAVAKMEVGGSRDASRSPPTQRHLHTHHHTHVGVTYPIYDPYGVAAQKSYT